MENESVSTQRNIFDVLMAATCERVLPKAVEPLEGKELCSDQQLYNDILGMSHIHTRSLSLSLADLCMNNLYYMYTYRQCRCVE